MSESLPNAGLDEAIKRQAAAWLTRQERGLSASEQDEFLQWLAADARHGAALGRHQHNWERFDVLGEWRPPGARADRDLLAPPPDRRRIPRRWGGLGLLAAAAVLFGLIAYSRRGAEPDTAPLPVSRVAEMERRVLEDGSVIELNRGAAITVAFSPAQRRVRLERGEAHFVVAKNPSRPFVVDVGDVEVRAVGTAFDVQLRPTAVEVVVSEGRVHVMAVSPDRPAPAVSASDAVGGVLLGARQRTVVPLRSAGALPRVGTLSLAELESRLAWQPRRLDYTAEPLRNIVAEFNRRNVPYHVAIADPTLGNLEVSASLRSDNLEGFFGMLETGFDVRVERAGHAITLRRR